MNVLMIVADTFRHDHLGSTAIPSSRHRTSTIHREHASPCIDDHAGLLHESGKIRFTHRCGTLQALIDAIRNERDDGVVDISPAPTSDLPLWEAREVWPDKIVVGGLDPTFLTSWTPDRVRECPAEILERSGGPDRLMIESGDAVPQTAKTDGLKAAGKAVRSFACDVLRAAKTKSDWSTRRPAGGSETAPEGECRPVTGGT